MKTLKRRGGALIEFALVLPIIFLLIFGSIQMANAIFLKQVLSEVAYHAALTGMRPDSSNQKLVDGINEMLTQRGITADLIEIEGPGGISFDATPSLSPFTVRIEVGTEQEYKGPTIMSAFNVQAESYAYRQ